MTVTVKARVAVTATVAKTATTTVTGKRKRVETVVRNRVLPKPTVRENNLGKTGNRGKNKTGKPPNRVTSNKANVNKGTITTVVRPVTISLNLKVKDLPKMTNRLKNRNLCLKGIILLFAASLLSACDKTDCIPFLPIPSHRRLAARRHALFRREGHRLTDLLQTVFGSS